MFSDRDESFYISSGTKSGRLSDGILFNSMTTQPLQNTRLPDVSFFLRHDNRADKFELTCHSIVFHVQLLVAVHTTKACVVKNQLPFHPSIIKIADKTCGVGHLASGDSLQLVDTFGAVDTLVHGGLVDGFEAPCGRTMKHVCSSHRPILGAQVWHLAPSSKKERRDKRDKKYSPEMQTMRRKEWRREGLSKKGRSE